MGMVGFRASGAVDRSSRRAVGSISCAIMMMMTPKLKVTIDVASVQPEDAMNVLRRISDVRLSDVALTENVAIERQSRYDPTTFVLHLPPDIGTEEADFLNRAGRAPDGRTLRALRFLYQHRREGRDIFLTNDMTLGTEGSEQRRRLADAARTRIMTLAEFEGFYVTGRA